MYPIRKFNFFLSVMRLPQNVILYIIMLMYNMLFISVIEYGQRPPGAADSLFNKKCFHGNRRIGYRIL